MQWNKTFGEYYIEIGYSIQQTSDGGYIVTADTRRGIKGNEGDIHLIKTDADGNTDWRKILDGFKGYLIDIASDRGYVITGVNGNGYLIKMKTDTDGNVLWTKAIEENFSGMVSSMYYSIQQTSDGGYLVYI